jgi:hypothetical protein
MSRETLTITSSHNRLRCPSGYLPLQSEQPSPHRVRVYSRTYASAAPMRSLGVGKYPCILEQAYRDLKGKEAVATHAMGTHHEET